MALLYTYAFAGLTDRFATGAFSLADWEELSPSLGKESQGQPESRRGESQ
jgi:hypothetical protein